jgi:hypothetical protein
MNFPLGSRNRSTASVVNPARVAIIAVVRPKT